MLRPLLPCLALLVPLLPALVPPPVAAAPTRAPAGAPQDFSDVTIEAIPVAGQVFMLTGAGGNLGLLTGPDGALLVDDQFAPLTEAILAVVAEHSEQPVRFVVNTHWHSDHTGGNENLGAAGAVIVAHENVRERMSVEQVMEAFDRTVPAAPEAALPRITFTDELTFHWNGETVQVMHVEDAHTDGDAILYFRGANVLHMGDCFFNGMYPFIDTGRRGNIDGMIAAAGRALALCDAQTRIIPGHGPLGGRAELEAFRDMLVTARDAIAALVEQGLERDAVIAARPTAGLDEQWGGGFMQPDQWVGIVYDGMQLAQQEPSRDRRAR